MRLAKNSSVKRTISLLVMLIFCFSNISPTAQGSTFIGTDYKLAAVSRFVPISLETHDGETVAVRGGEGIERPEPTETFLEDVMALYLSLKIGDILDNYGTKMDAKGIADVLKQHLSLAKKTAGIDLDTVRFNPNNIYKDELLNIFHLPYKRLDNGRVQLLSFYLEGEASAGEASSAVPVNIGIRARLVVEGEDAVTARVPSEEGLLETLREIADGSERAKGRLDVFVAAEISRRRAASEDGKTLPAIEQVIRPAEERILDTEEVGRDLSIMDALIEANRCIQCRNPKCQLGHPKLTGKEKGGCPVALNIAGMIAAFREGNIGEAHRILEKDNVLGEVTSRVCPQESQCQMHCALSGKGNPIQIGQIERMVKSLFYAIYGSEEIFKPSSGLPVSEKVSPEKAFNVAVIGSGPSGLTAAEDLARRGYNVTIFEAFHEAGGVLMYGIPEFRLPKAIVQKKIRQLETLGVRIVRNVSFGNSFTVEDLRRWGFKAIFLGTGAGKPVTLDIPGKELNGVTTANDYLTRYNLMKSYLPGYDTPILRGKNVVVIGSGNVAMDAARTAKRLGAEVTIVYRRTEKEMSARLDEMHHAKEEGITFKLLTSPLRFEGEEGWVKKLIAEEMELGEPDQSGRRKPVPVKGAAPIEIKADLVLQAIGTKPNTELLKQIKSLELTDKGTVVHNPESGQTTVPDIFVGGDAATGAATVISAMGAGKRAAKGIDAYLTALTEDSRKIELDKKVSEAQRFTIKEKTVLGKGIKMIKVYAPFVAEKAQAGQFVTVLNHEKGERIPLTLADWDRDEGTITLVYQEVGKSTMELGTMGIGDELYAVFGPIGTPEAMHDIPYGRKIIFVAGGVGVAPIYPILREYSEKYKDKNKGVKIITIVGARSPEYLIWEDKIRALSDEVHIVFDFMGDKPGKRVTEPLEDILSKKRDEYYFSHVIAIGPGIMMQKVTELASKYGVPTYVSLNPNMLDMTGMCGQCEILTRGKEGKLACIHGPGGFLGSEVKWDVFHTRSKQFAESERRALKEWKLSEKYNAAIVQEFINVLVKAVEEKRAGAKKENEEIFIGIDKSWIPGVQMALPETQTLLNELNYLHKKKGFENVRVVVGHGSTVAALIQAQIASTNVPLTNLVIVTDKKKLGLSNFDVFRGKEGEEGAFFAGIELPEGFQTSNIRLVEMAKIALSLAVKSLDPAVVMGNPYIDIKMENPRSFTFMPKADPFDLEELKELYEIQRNQIDIKA